MAVAVAVAACALSHTTSHFLSGGTRTNFGQSSSSSSPLSDFIRPHRTCFYSNYSSSHEYAVCFNSGAGGRLTFACASLYQVLGISPAATSQEIKTAYRNLARVCHPDVVAAAPAPAPAPAPIDVKQTSDHFINIHAAYSTLSDPQKRADYDRNLFTTVTTPFKRSRRTTTYASTSAAASGYRPRRTNNWETDQCW